MQDLSDYKFVLAKPYMADELLHIYEYYIRHSAVTFEIDVPTVDDFALRIANTIKDYPYIVALKKREQETQCIQVPHAIQGSLNKQDLKATLGSHGIHDLQNFKDIANAQDLLSHYVIVGYIYIGRFKSRKAYDLTVESSIYLDKEERGKGLGRELYKKVMAISKLQGITSIIACISHTDDENDPHLTNDSMAFHKALDFSLCGKLVNVGYKFERFYNIIYMQKELVSAEHGKAESFISIDKLSKEVFASLGIDLVY